MCSIKDPQGRVDLKICVAFDEPIRKKNAWLLFRPMIFCTPASFKKTGYTAVMDSFGTVNDSQLDNIKKRKSSLAYPKPKSWNVSVLMRITVFGCLQTDYTTIKIFHPIDEYGITTHATQINNMDEFENIPPESQIRINDTFHVTQYHRRIYWQVWSRKVRELHKNRARCICFISFTYPTVKLLKLEVPMVAILLRKIQNM